MLRRCARSSLQLLEVLVEARAQQAPLDTVGSRAGEHDEVPRRQRELVAKGFAGDSLDSVAVHGTFRIAARDGQAETRVRAAARAGKDSEKAIAGTRGLGENAPKRRRRMQPEIGREACCAGTNAAPKRNPLRSEPSATLGAATGENFAAGARRHAGTETVRAFTVQVARLKSAFHAGVLRAGKSSC